ncbi:hypothetical protein [Paractinoplanes durhamensis]|uniref:hypothetical protein n=1 Tax=Paractinoplanes durhamensis TaxID=113563 RepID=UPI00362DF2D1
MFGESGSGKTVLLSSFYGATQEPQYLQNNLFDVVADDIGQHTRLHQNYLGMKNSSRRPRKPASPPRPTPFPSSCETPPMQR